MMKLIDTKTSDPDGTKYITSLSTKNAMIVTKDLLKSRIETYLGSIPIYSEYYINKSLITHNNKLMISFS